MSLRIYNSLTKRKEEFVPRQKGKVGIYVCGVTVYDECHLGHARSAFIFDIIVRYLRYKGYKVKFVKNITDIDDKIITKAREELGDSLEADIQAKVKEVAERYTESYYRDMELLGIEHADIEPKATRHIQDMIKVIKGLIAKGYAYEVDGDVYFEVRKYPDYGKLSKQDLDQMSSGVRIAPDERKRDPLDFALWKSSKEGEPSWKSPWGKGRPGWHIECSVMSMKYLGKSFDIHGGGRDLIFPHHENEVAQAESQSGRQFARYWMHNGLLTINGQKMAKSLKNFVSIPEILEKFHPEVLKIFFLSTHYSHPADFSFHKMDEAQKARERFYILLKKINDLTRKRIGRKRDPQVNALRKAFFEAMDDDFNTPRALSALFDIVSLANRHIDNPKSKHQELLPFLQYTKSTLIELGQILGISFREDPASMPETEIEKSINLRAKLRDEKKFDQADQIRRELEEKGIILEDEKGGKTLWRRKL